MPTIKLPNGYVTEKTSNGFIFHEAGPLDAESMAGFATACVELGHRLAKEGKQIEEVRLMRHWSHTEGAEETFVKVKIKHVLANAQAEPRA